MDTRAGTGMTAGRGMPVPSNSVFVLPGSGSGSNMTSPIPTKRNSTVTLKENGIPDQVRHDDRGGMSALFSVLPVPE